MVDHSNMRLGKRTARHDRRVPMLAKYTAALPPPPPSVDYTTKLTNLGMMLNDKLGDCTCAAVGHCVQQWTSLTRPAEVIIPDPDIEALYEKVGGYVPGQPSTDNGAVEVDVLNYWLANPVDANALDAYASIEPKNRGDVSDAVYIFGNCYIGVQLPISAQTQDTWAVPPGGAVNDGAPGSWGGHAIPVVAYNHRTLTVITWGALKQMTWQFLDAYCDEAYALLSPDWQLSSGNVPPNFPWSTVVADIQDLKATFTSAKAIKHV
jgi:hypothetical protein